MPGPDGCEAGGIPHDRIVVFTIFLSSRNTDTTPRTVYTLDGIYRTNSDGELDEVSPLVPKDAIEANDVRRRSKPSSTRNADQTAAASSSNGKPHRQSGGSGGVGTR